MHLLRHAHYETLFFNLVRLHGVVVLEDLAFVVVNTGSLDAVPYDLPE